MTNYKIFDTHLPNDYIAELTEDELDILIDEATQEHVRLEREIDKLCWEDAPQIDEGGSPVNGVWPSEFSYLPILYRDEIDGNPGLERKLAEATELSKRVGLVLAVRGSAKLHKSRIAALRSKIEMLEKNL